MPEGINLLIDRTRGGKLPPGLVCSPVNNGLRRAVAALSLYKRAFTAAEARLALAELQSELVETKT
jgi:hypothetical protein